MIYCMITSNNDIIGPDENTPKVWDNNTTRAGTKRKQKGEMNKANISLN